MDKPDRDQRAHATTPSAAAVKVAPHGLIVRVAPPASQVVPVDAPAVVGDPAAAAPGAEAAEVVAVVGVVAVVEDAVRAAGRK
jgi:hypothetical protein